MNNTNSNLVTKQYKIKKLHSKGFGIPEECKKDLQIWNALPGEEISVDFLKGKRSRKKSLTAKEVLTESKYRINPVEPDHFLSCSPWQIIDWKKENDLKKDLVLNIFANHKINIPENVWKDFEIVSDNKQYGYRNKMEFSFYIDDNEKIHIAFHKRGSRGITPISGCKLASDVINETAEKIVSWINEIGIAKRSLKTLIVRSNQKGESIASLFIKDELVFEKYPEIDDQFNGFTIYYSNHKSPASTADKLLYQNGRNYLKESIEYKVSGKNISISFKYGLLSFFQVNIPMFDKVLNRIVEEISENSEVVDFYSGVGSISLSIANKVKTLTLVDSNQESIEFAKKNIVDNQINNAKAVCLPAEKITELISSDKIIIVDPPRSGMHSAVVDKLLLELPPKIIYLSCNPNTQAMDLERLVEKYKIKSMEGFNFFPRTPHIENLVVLEKC